MAGGISTCPFELLKGGIGGSSRSGRRRIGRNGRSGFFEDDFWTNEKPGRKRTGDGEKIQPSKKKGRRFLGHSMTKNTRMHVDLPTDNRRESKKGVGKFTYAQEVRL